MLNFCVQPISKHSIINGTLAPINEFAFQAAIIYRHYGTLCGGSIIHEKYVLTAAHCTQYFRDVNPSSYTVKAGASNVDRLPAYVVSRIERHPLYSKPPVKYDIAILLLQDKLAFSETIKPIRLADADAVLYRGQMLNVSGWGLTEHGSGSDELLYGTVAYIESDFCQKAYDVEHLVVDESMFCAGFEGVGGTDSCQGDSGGPIVANNVQYGVVSWGLNCADPLFPGVYANVAHSHARKWIFEQTGV